MEEQKRFSITINMSLYNWLKRYAFDQSTVDNRISMNQVVVNALEDFKAKEDKKNNDR